MLPPIAFNNAMMPEWILRGFPLFNISREKELDATVHNPEMGKEIKTGKIW